MNPRSPAGAGLRLLPPPPVLSEKRAAAMSLSARSLSDGKEVE